MMLLAFVSGLGPDKTETDLCLVPDKPDLLSMPVRIRDIQVTSAAVHRIGPDESVIASHDDQDKSIIISTLSGGSIFLTPNLPQSPGFRCRKIRILEEGRQFRTFYEREGKNWEEWVANKERQ